MCGGGHGRGGLRYLVEEMLTVAMVESFIETIVRIYKDMKGLDVGNLA
jgi:hypothetical protein